MNLIDFTDCKTLKKGYGGANGNKISVIYNNDIYMLKFPSPATKNDNLSYSNSVFSEYLGSHIFALAGIPVQRTLLGHYKISNQDKLVVACRDFTSPGIILQDFASQKNRVISSSQNGYGTELEDILNTLDSLPEEISEASRTRFWEMFIVDALIGNWDRHNGNWGILYNMHEDTLSLAPVYDCGSSLFPQADEEIMKKCLASVSERHTRVFNIPLSAIKAAGKKINYFDFIYSNSDAECTLALETILKRLDMDKVNKLIEDTPCLSKLQKDFYKTMLSERYSLILVNSYKHIKDISTKRSR